MANAIRFLTADAVEKANSGHPGMPLGMADVATTLYSRFMKFDPTDPKWCDRDRFILSAGHGSMLLYSLAYLTGYADCDIEQIRNFRQLDFRTCGHPEYGHISIADTTTGPLGQGIANAVGMALAEKMTAARWGEELVNHYTYCIVGDGCLMEGVSQEAIVLAGHWRLSKLIVLWDDNHISIDGDISLSSSEDQHLRFKAAGWSTLSVDGHNQEEIAAAIEKARHSDRPTMIACRTTIGWGSPSKAGSEKAHGAPLGAADIADMRKNLGWTAQAFEIPEKILADWRAVPLRGATARKEWESRLKGVEPAKRASFLHAMSGEIPETVGQALQAFKAKISGEQPKWATRKASQEVLEIVQPLIAELVGGSADLTHSNLTNTRVTKPVDRDDFSGNYVRYGVREHAMGAIMNGLALHQGIIPYGGTFFVFSDYLRPALRMSALMGLRVLYILTHDSIGLGEDGPTHQPVEHLASLRAMPTLLTFRPCDAVETAECYEIALSCRNRPSVFALSRHNVPTARSVHTKENLSALGAYVLSKPDRPAEATLLATGSEVSTALAAQDILSEQGIAAAVVSMPCWELFDEQPLSYRNEVLGKTALRVAIEAGSTFGWDRYVKEGGAIVGMKSFGASGPADRLFERFEITARSVADVVLARLGRKP
ncbi:transketolase [Alphaproteobacteria bacterium]|nr:transketolase [Alphaproteobacteria bacterium]